MENTQPVSNLQVIKKRRFPKFLTSGWFIILTCVVLVVIWVIINIPSPLGEFLGIENAESDNSEFVYDYYKGDKESNIKVARLELNGPIIGIGGDDPLAFLSPGGIDGKYVSSQLDKLAQDKDIKAVLIDLTTPGGDPWGSSDIADAIEFYQRKTNQKVYVFVNELSASGGAWASAPASTIIASPIAILGSIGVAGGYAPKFTNITSYSQGVLGYSVDANIDFTPLYRGKCKQPDNELNISNEYIKDCIDPDLDGLYSAFVDHISKYNQISPEIIRNEIGARVFFGNSAEAKNYGLVDQVGNEEFAIQIINQELNQGNPVQIVNVSEYTGGLLEALFGSVLHLSNTKTSLAHTSFCQSNTPLLLYGDINQIRTSICKE
jgi:protease-4